MSRCTRPASKRTGCRGGVAEGDVVDGEVLGGDALGVGRGEDVGDKVITGVTGSVGVGTGASAGPEHPTSSADKAATRIATRLIW